MAGLNAGDLDREVTILALTESAGSSGFPVETWTVLDDVFMARETQRRTAVEKMVAGQLSASFDTLWTLQFRDDMDPDVVDVPKTRRLLYRGRTYEITAAVELGRREGILVTTMASSGVA